MRRILAGLALALLIASPVYGKAGASITAGDGPFTFGQSVSRDTLVVSWTPANGKPASHGYWAQADCSQGGTLVYRQYQSLDSDVQAAGFAFGPTPSWPGGGADCTLTLLRTDDGAFRAVATAAFVVGP